MATFSVTGTGYVTVYTTVEADTLEEAEEKVSKLSYGDFDVDSDMEIDFDSIDVSEINRIQ